MAIGQARKDESQAALFPLDADGDQLANGRRLLDTKARCLIFKQRPTTMQASL